MLVFPVLSGMLLGGASWAGTAFAVLAGAGLWAHESALVALGRRGERLRAAQEAKAKAQLIRLAAMGTVAAGLFVLRAPRDAWLPACVGAALAVLMAGLAASGRTRTLGGEILVAAAFASVHGAVAASGGAGTAAIYLPAAAWTASFGLATLAVHSVKYRFRRTGPGRWTMSAAPAVAAGILMAGPAAAAGGLPLAAGLIPVLPKATVVLALGFLAVHPRHLKRVGWTLVAADTLTLVLLLALLG